MALNQNYIPDVICNAIFSNESLIFQQIIKNFEH